MKWIWIISILMLAGCASTTGVNKELPMNLNQEGSGNNITMNINLDLDSDTMGESGDPRISPQTSASLYGPSQAAGTEALMDDLKYVIEKWMDNRKTDSDNTTTSTTTTTPVEPEVPVLPDGGMDIGDLEVIEPDLADYDIAAEAACDTEISQDQMKTIQKRCVFSKEGTAYGKSFLVQWSSGNKLYVPNSQHMTLDPKTWAKYWAQEPIPHGGGLKPGTGAEVYAPKGDNSRKAAILVKR